LSTPAFSTPAFSTLAILTVSNFSLPHFQSPRLYIKNRDGKKLLLTPYIDDGSSAATIK